MLHLSPYVLIGFCLGATTAHGACELRRDLLAGAYYLACAISGWVGIIWLTVGKL